MSIRKDKCELFKPSIEFLGFLLDGKNLKPSKSNLAKIRTFPVSKTRRELQRFLGLANYNRRFIDGYSRVVAPLNRLTSTKVTYLWSGDEEAAFENIKKKFQENLSLYIPDWTKPFVIKTDALKIAYGSVLGQFEAKKSLKPLGYNSETLTKGSR